MCYPQLLLGLMLLTNVTLTTSFLGKKLFSPIGIAACPLTATAKGVTMCSQNGYDIITYKTIRSSEKEGYQAPHMFSIDTASLAGWSPGDTIVLSDTEHAEYNQQKEIFDTITNSYGISSKKPIETVLDIQQSKSLLHPNQMLIVSIYGSGNTKKEIINDFIKAAYLAVIGNADALELNLSCPNITKGMIYEDHTMVYDLCKAVKQTFPHIPLIIKVGYFNNLKNMKAVLCAAHYAGVRAICGINSIPISIIDEHGHPLFGKQRAVSGLSGAKLLPYTQEFIKNARAIIENESLDLALCATGGITQAHQFDLLLEAGADVVQCATGALLNPNLAKEYHYQTALNTRKRNVIVQLWNIHAIQLKDTVIKSGATSPIYFDMRTIISYPDIFKEITSLMIDLMNHCEFDIICGVPYAAIPLATAIATQGNAPLIMLRKETKNHGTKKMVEGTYQPNALCAVIEDVISTGSSILETIAIMQDHNLIVKDIFIIIDREQNGVGNVQKHGYRIHSLFTITEILDVLLAEKYITHDQYKHVQQFCLDSQTNDTKT